MQQRFQNKSALAGFAFSSILAVLVSAVPGCRTAPPDDPVEYSFVVVGCNRLEKGDVDLDKNPSTANLAQLDRTLNEIATLSPKPEYFFFAGDMIIGYQMDTNKLDAELMAWRTHYEQSPAAKAGIKLVAVSGNHEMEDTAKKAFPEAETQWNKVMAPYTYAHNGPTSGGADSLATDESSLSYSFDFKDTHFVILDTDPVGQDNHVPAHWVAQDLATARKNGAKHLFAIGHKPAFSWDGGGDDGLVAGNRGAFWDAMEANHAEAMITAHNHVYRAFQPHGNKTWMIIAGDGGSKLEKAVPPEKQFYGYTLVSILKSGKVIAKSYGRNLPTDGYAADAPVDKYPTTLRDSIDITWKD